MADGGQETGLDYWALAGEVDLAVAPSGEVRPKSAEQLRLVGREQARLDLPAKVFGSAYIQDLTRPGMVHARVLRQPGAEATLVVVDEAAVRRAASAAGGEIDIVREGSFIAFVSASERAASLRLTFDAPARRFSKMMGASPMEQPALRQR